MDIIGVAVGVFVGTITADILVATIVTLRAKREYARRIQLIREAVDATANEAETVDQSRGYR